MQKLWLTRNRIWGNIIGGNARSGKLIEGGNKSNIIIVVYYSRVQGAEAAADRSCEGLVL